MSPSPYGLRIDGGGDQFAVSGAAPRLSWKPPAGGGHPTGFEIEATVDGEARAATNRGSAQHLYVPWPWSPLRSRQRVSWRVRVTGDAGASDWSQRHEFEAGLLDEDWQARWISPVEAGDPGYGRRPAHTLSTAFEVAGEVVTARLYATALGVYEAFVNGERAGTAELSPGATSYDRTLYAQASDVTGALRPGTNRLAIVLSDGWYRGQVGAFRMPAGWGTVLGARAELHLEYADGARQVVRSDRAWTSARSVITRADLMDGQTVDFGAVPGAEFGAGRAAEFGAGRGAEFGAGRGAEFGAGRGAEFGAGRGAEFGAGRGAEAGAGEPVLVDRVAGPAIDWSPAPPVRAVQTRPAVSVDPVADGVWVADFGQNASGWVVLTDLGPAGTRTVIDYGEHVGADGDLTTAHLDAARPGEPPTPFVQRDEVISAGRGETFEPRHTVHGFRYARLRRAGVPLDPASVTMRVVHTDLRRTGTFGCSDDDLTRLHEIAEWSFRGNAVDVPTDCPTRERLAWTGDYQVFAPTATRLYDVLGFSRKWLRSVRDDQLADGRIANFSPDGRRIKLHLDDRLAMMTGSAGWGDAIVAVPWELYEAYGDREVLAENWAAMVRWVRWALTTAGTARHPSRVERSAEPLPHERFLWDGSFHWGEWAEPKPKAADGTRIDPLQANPMAWFAADKGEIGTAYLYRSASTLARVAEVLGRTADAAHYADVAGQVRAAWRTEFLRADGRTAGDTQASYVRAFSFGLVPDDLRGAAAARLAELIRAAGTHLTTGFLSTGDLLPVLCDTGQADLAYELLFQRTEPSWLAMLDRGATTIWEDWDGIDADGVAHDSLNHYSKGAVIRFLHTHTLGLRQAPASVAWESFVVAPVPGPLTWAAGSHETPRGTISVAWEVDEHDFHITVEVPPATTATIVFPDGTTETASEGLFSVGRPLPDRSPGFPAG